MRTRPAVTRSGSGLTVQRSVLAEAAKRKPSNQQKTVRRPPPARRQPIPTIVEPPPQVQSRQEEELVQPAGDGLTITEIPDNSSDPSKNESVSAPMLNALLQFRNDQLDFQEEIRSSIGSLPSQKSVPKPPTLTSTGFAKQQEFNLLSISALNDIKSASKNNPALIGEIVDKELRRIKSRNSQLVMADRFPGSLSIMESLQDLADLKNDPDCAPFLSETLQLCGANARRSQGQGRYSGPGGQPFWSRGRGRGAPGQQYHPPQYSQWGQYPPAAASMQLPGLSSAPYYANQQQGMVLFSGNRAPRSVVGPCNWCHAFGHLQRECAAKAQFESGRQISAVSAQGPQGVRTFPTPPPAIAWPGGNYGGPAAPQQNSQ
ncbi:MAG: hypothetical protein GY696_02920 [Gammaproteobacteria bacterium]|nr:hypothetical protein [Gammaproteobacteria bacterium]